MLSQRDFFVKFFDLIKKCLTNVGPYSEDNPIILEYIKKMTNTPGLFGIYGRNPKEMLFNIDAKIQERQNKMGNDNDTRPPATP